MEIMEQFLVAYVDPGSGAMLVQAIIASILGAGTWITTKLFRRHKENKQSPEGVANSLQERATASIKSKTQLLRELNQ